MATTKPKTTSTCNTRNAASSPIRPPPSKAGFGGVSAGGIVTVYVKCQKIKWELDEKNANNANNASQKERD